MKIDLIVTSRDNRTDMERLINSLLIQKQFVRIIFINQNAESYADLLSSFDYVEIMTQHLALSKARNLGLSYCTNELVGFPDDDCWYEEEFFTKLFNYFLEECEVDIVCTSVFDPLSKCTYGRRPLNIICDVGYSNILELPISVGIFLRRNRLVKYITFDEKLGAGAPIGSGEETNLLLELFNRSAVIRYNGFLKVFHELPKFESDTKVFNYAIGYGFLLRKMCHYDLLYGVYFLIRVLLRCFLLYVLLILFSKRKKFYLRFIGVIEGFRKLPDD